MTGWFILWFGLRGPLRVVTGLYQAFHLPNFIVCEGFRPGFQKLINKIVRSTFLQLCGKLEISWIIPRRSCHGCQDRYVQQRRCGAPTRGRRRFYVGTALLCWGGIAALPLLVGHSHISGSGGQRLVSVLHHCKAILYYTAL